MQVSWFVVVVVWYKYAVNNITIYYRDEQELIKEKAGNVYQHHFSLVSLMIECIVLH